MSKKKKLEKLTKFVLACICVIILYTICEIIISTITGVTHDTLTTSVYAFFGTELASCTVIQCFKLSKTKSEVESDDI